MENDLLTLAGQIRHVTHYRLSLGLCLLKPIAIQVSTSQVMTPMTFLHAVRIQQRNEDNHVLAEKLK